jgi:hypothetical protein
MLLDELHKKRKNCKWHHLEQTLTDVENPEDIDEAKEMQ